MSKMKKIMIVMLAVGAIHAAAELTQADIEFVRLSSNSTENVAEELLMTVSDASDGKVTFELFNNGTSGTDHFAVTHIYFDDGAVLGDFVSFVLSGTMVERGVSFSQWGSPSELPEANNALPEFNTSAGLYVSSNSPTYWDGIGPGESLSITYELLVTFDLLEAAIEAGNNLDSADDDADEPTSLRVGLHVQGLAPNATESDSYISGPPLDPEPGPVPIPVPGAASLGMIGLGMVGWWKRRTGKVAVA